MRIIELQMNLEALAHKLANMADVCTDKNIGAEVVTAAKELLNHAHEMNDCDPIPTAYIPKELNVNHHALLSNHTMAGHLMAEIDALPTSVTTEVNEHITFKEEYEKLKCSLKEAIAEMRASLWADYEKLTGGGTNKAPATPKPQPAKTEDTVAAEKLADIGEKNVADTTATVAETVPATEASKTAELPVTDEVKPEPQGDAKA
jgi:hypothetical protein